MLADKTTDTGHKEQLSISLRFVEEGEFLCFTEVTDFDRSRLRVHNHGRNANQGPQP